VLTWCVLLRAWVCACGAWGTGVQPQPLRGVFDVFGLRVNRMIRTEVGPYKLGTLPKGAALQVPLHPSLKTLLPR
jgi:hypothetical protein